MKYKIPIKILEFNDKGNHIMVEGILLGYKMHLLIDTGASLTVFDIRRIRTIIPEPDIKTYDKFFMGIGTSKIETYSMVIDKLQLGDCNLLNHEVVLIDMENINKAYAAFDLPRIDGIIGGEILKQYDAIIDYGNSVLELSI